MNCFGLPQNKLGKRQAKALDLSSAVTLPAARQDQPPIAKPQFSLLEDVEAELHTIVHSKLLRSNQTPISDLQKTALHGIARFTQAAELHDRIANIGNELEADLFLVEQETKLVKDKIFGS